MINPHFYREQEMRPLIEARHYISNETRGHTSTHHQLKSVCMSVCITLNAGILGRPDVKTQLIKYFVFLIVVNPIKLKVSLLSSLRLFSACTDSGSSRGDRLAISRVFPRHAYSFVHEYSLLGPQECLSFSKHPMGIIYSLSSF